MTTSLETSRDESSPVIKPFLFGASKARTALPQPRILLAEDNGQMCLLLAVCLKEAGYDVVQCFDGLTLFEHLGSYLLLDSNESYELVISDVRMPHMSGLEVLQDLGERDDFPPMILITAFGDEETHTKARALGAAAFFDKPFSVQDLVAKVRELVPIQDPPALD